MRHVLVLGSTNLDLTLDVPRLPAPGETVMGESSYRQSQGGKGANQAVASARAGAEVTFLSALGDDTFGREALARFREEGIDAEYVVIDSESGTGVALIVVDEHGENQIAVAPGANARLRPEHIDALPNQLFEQADIGLASLEVPLPTVARFAERARCASTLVLLNPAPSTSVLVGHPLWNHVDLMTPNRVEAALLAGLPVDSDPADLARGAAGSFDVSVILTLGGDGCLVLDQSVGILCARRALAVEPVDTVGAGDAFSGVLAASLAEGIPLVEAADRANVAAALATQAPGAQEALPRRAEIDRIWRSRQDSSDGPQPLTSTKKKD